MKGMNGKNYGIACIVTVLYIVINLYTVGVYNFFQALLIIGFSILVARKIIPFITALNWFSNKKSEYEYHDNNEIKDQKISIIKKSQYKIASYIAGITVGIFAVGFVISAVIRVCIKAQSNYSAHSLLLIPYIVYIADFIIYYIFNKLFYFEPLQIEYEYSKKIVELDDKNVRAHYHIAIVNAYYKKAKECLEELKIVVKLDERYKRMIKDDNRFGKADISNLDEFKEITYEDPIKLQNKNRAEYLSR